MADKAESLPQSNPRPASHDAPGDAPREPAPIAKTRLADTIKHGGRIYQLMVESVRDYAIFMLDPSGQVVSWNQGAERINGYLSLIHI